MPFDVRGYLDSLQRFGMKPGLERITAILERLGHPERAFPAIHVGGTNGKGSISSMAAQVLKEAGYTVGLYTSPHLVRYNERIRIGGEPIDDAALEELFEEVAAAAEDAARALGERPTEFEVGTAAAFLHFARRRVEVAVVEVGLGGRWDSTNVLDPLAVALGPISLDHTSVLGSSVREIAGDKVGIFRRGAPAVIAPQLPEAEAVIRSAGEELPCPLWWVRAAPGQEGTGLGSLVSYTPLGWGLGGGRLDVTTPRSTYRGLRFPLLGEHQLANAAVSVALVDAAAGRGLRVEEEAVRRGLERARWPGRMQWIPGDPPLLLDGAHNPAGAKALAASLEQLFRGEPVDFLMAVTGDRKPSSLIDPLVPFARRFVFTRPGSSRLPGVDPALLAEHARARGVEAEVVEPVEEAVETVLARARRDGGIACACGSLYLVGEILAHLEGKGRLRGEEKQGEEKSP